MESIAYRFLMLLGLLKAESPESHQTVTFGSLGDYQFGDRSC